MDEGDLFREPVRLSAAGFDGAGVDETGTARGIGVAEAFACAGAGVAWDCGVDAPGASATSDGSGAWNVTGTFLAMRRFTVRSSR